MFFQKRGRQTAAACVLLALVVNPLPVQASLPQTPYLKPVQQQGSVCNVVAVRFWAIRNRLALAGQTPEDVFLIYASATPYELYWRLGFNVVPSAWLASPRRGVPFAVVSVQTLVRLKRFITPAEEREVINLVSQDEAFECFSAYRVMPAAP